MFECTYFDDILYIISQLLFYYILFKSVELECISLSLRFLSLSLSFLWNDVLLNIHSIYVLILITYSLMILSSSFLAMSVVVDHLFKVGDLTDWSIVVLLNRIFLGEALNYRPSTDIRNLWFLSTTRLFIRRASCRVCSLYKLTHFLLLVIEVLQHLRPRHLWSLSCFTKNLRSTLNHLLDWFVIFIQFLRLVVLLVRIWLTDVVSVLGTVVMSMEIVLRMAAVILFDGVVDFAN